MENIYKLALRCKRISDEKMGLAPVIGFGAIKMMVL